MTSPKLPFSITNVTDEEDKVIKKYYKEYMRPFLRVGPAGYLLTPGYADHAADIYNLDVRPDDIWVVTFSRSGTTWLQELVWLVANNLDFEGAQSVPLNTRYAYIEYPTLESDIRKESSEGPRATEEDFRTLPNLSSPRYVKTHLPLSLLPPKLLDTAKVLYVARDPRDVAVSYFFMHKLFGFFDESVEFEEYWELFKKDLLMNMPIFPHREEAWQKRNHPNLMFLLYEEMQKDLIGVIDRVSSFLGREYTAEQKDRLAKHLNFDNMKKRTDKDDNQSELKFIRKGKSGNWVNYFNEQMKKEAEEYMEKQLEKTDLRFPESTMTSPKLPFTIANVTDEEDKVIKKYYKGYTRPFLRVGPAGYLLPPGYGDHAADIYNLDVRPDDIWVVPFSRSGTTWLQELVWLVANNLDFERAQSLPLNTRFSFIEYPSLASDIRKEPFKGPPATEDDFRTLPGLPSPRYVKTHLPLSLLPPKLLDTAKVFYVARDPRDVAVSSFFMHKLFRYFDLNVEFEEYWELFKKDLVLRTPIFPHIEEAWQKRNHPNLMFLFYEDMQKDLISVIDRVSSFLGREYTAEQKDRLAKYLNFDNMKKRTETDDSQSELKFMRKGKSGTWENYFNEQMKKESEEYMEKHLEKTDLRFPKVNN